MKVILSYSAFFLSFQPSCSSLLLFPSCVKEFAKNMKLIYIIDERNASKHSCIPAYLIMVSNHTLSTNGQDREQDSFPYICFIAFELACLYFTSIK